MSAAEFIVSSFGGGWLIPKTEKAQEVFIPFFGEPPAELAPLNGVVGWIVEPWQIEPLAGLFLSYQIWEGGEE